MTVKELEIQLQILGAYKLNGNWVVPQAALAVLASKIKL